jgi:hypothetical protein
LVDQHPCKLRGRKCGFNRSMRHSRACTSSEGVAIKQRRRMYRTESQKAVMWERWRQGETLQQIARLFERYHIGTGDIGADRQNTACTTTPIQTRPEARRTRGDIALSGGGPINPFGSTVAGRAPTNRNCAIRRNGESSDCRANHAEQLALDRVRPPKTCKLVRNRELTRAVADKL